MSVGSLAGATVLVAGVVLGSLGLRERQAQLRTGANGFVNSDRPGLDAHNSPAVAVHPGQRDVLAVADRIDTPRFSCSVALSANGGSTWAPVALPLPPAAPNCFWPDVGFAADGDLLVLYTATGGRFNHPVGVWLQRFRGRAASGAPVAVAGPEAFHARLAVEGSRVVATWVQARPETAEKPLGFAPPPNPILLSRSEDGGRTFSPPTQVSEDDRRVAQPTVLLGGEGQVVVGALDLADDVLDYEAGHEGQGGPPHEGRWRVVGWTSPDGGVTFGPAAVVDDDLVVPQRIVVDLAPTPGFAHDPGTGRLYAAWDAGRGDGRDVFLSSSDDGGAAWSPPRRVAPGPGAQVLPAVAVADDGRVDVLFYDRRRDPRDVMTEVVLASSWDGGRSFATATLSDRPFDSRIGLGSAQGIPLLGSQLAVHSEPAGAVALWADTRHGSEATNIQDLAVALVAVRAPQGGRPWLVAVGALATAGGLALVVVAGAPFPGRRGRAGLR